MIARLLYFAIFKKFDWHLRVLNFLKGLYCKRYNFHFLTCVLARIRFWTRFLNPDFQIRLLGHTLRRTLFGSWTRISKLKEIINNGQSWSCHRDLWKTMFIMKIVFKKKTSFVKQYILPPQTNNHTAKK